ncbi:MAG: Cellulose synthase (UDP-forming) [Candidatus Woesebacteria bacterium GW2011_GWA1_39_8]|uniref:Cellulose synthase (UDP-forming) n=1 Tax=Candidatus Woesebacteria bacterium GW2011_GWA1_39_8 TaxID=1618552 RepID=A0A0G0PLD3_9BACT|nr:MAG: Cellulose synthase (UDP-forming) [Candidatus Woesebacteria bacterium GW2011_GWA1_39_8]
MSFMTKEIRKAANPKAIKNWLQRSVLGKPNIKPKRIDIDELAGVVQTNQNRFIAYVNSNQYHKIAGIVFVVATLNYLLWLLGHLNLANKLISIPFFISQLFSFLLVSLSIFNHWKAKYRTNRPAMPLNPPDVAVVVATYKEPVAVLENTIKSILEIDYPGKVVVVVSNDDERPAQRSAIENTLVSLADYRSRIKGKVGDGKVLHLVHTTPHKNAKAGNLNQALRFLRKYYPEIDLVLTQDADEIVYPEILKALVGYFSEPQVGFVQTIKQSEVTDGDPFGNDDMMWYARTAACRDAAGAMFACGSGVIWRISALESIGGFSTWNLVEDLTTSYQILSHGWESRYHYERLSYGLAPEDLPNFLKQRGTWAIDHMRLFFWDNPLKKKGLTIRQKLHFLEPQLFYLNGVAIVVLSLATSLSLVLEKWPTTVDAITHAKYLIPSFIALEAYYLLLADSIRLTRIRQFWVGLSPTFAVATLKALIYGPNRKPKYIVTRKENEYGNYIRHVLPQLIILSVIFMSLVKIFISTPLYSAFDWAAVFWGFYQASFFFHTIRVAWWKWNPNITISVSLPGIKSYNWKNLTQKPAMILQGIKNILF